MSRPKARNRKQRKDNKFRETTMQIPAGTGSIFDALEKREVNAREATVYIVLNAHSNWATGNTHKMSYAELSNIFGWHRSYFGKIVPRLIKSGFVKRTSKPNLTSTYKLTHHNCPKKDIPLDKDERPLKFAASLDKHGPLAKFMDGKITWQAFLVWNVMHMVFDWGTQEGKISQADLIKKTGLGQKALAEAFRSLERAGLMDRHPRKPHEVRGYQLYPMKRPETKKGRRAEEKKERYFRQQRSSGFNSEGWAESNNGLYRMHRLNGEIEWRPENKGTWLYLSDFRKQQMPSAIKEHFEALIAKEAASSSSISEMRRAAGV